VDGYLRRADHALQQVAGDYESGVWNRRMEKNVVGECGAVGEADDQHERMERRKKLKEE
jgi:hypothetical protein